MGKQFRRFQETSSLKPRATTLEANTLSKKKCKVLEGLRLTLDTLELSIRNAGIKHTRHVFYLPVVSPFLGDLRWVARFGLMSQIGASQIKAPIGSVFQKYVSSTFIVKMRIDLGS